MKDRKNVVVSVFCVRNGKLTVTSKRKLQNCIKKEFLLEEIKPPIGEIKSVINDAINTYKKRRQHYSCGYLAPCQRHLQREVNTYKKNIIATIKLQ